MHLLKRHTNSPQRGGALLVSLILMTVIAGLGMGLVQVNHALTRRQTTAIDTKRALYVAEAGLSEAFHALAIGQGGNVGTPEEPAAFGKGLFWVEAEQAKDGSVMLSSVGLVGTGRYAISHVVTPSSSSSLAPAGVFGLDQVVIGAGAVLDGWNPADGAYQEPGALGLAGDVTGTNASVSSNGDIQVQADPTTGLGGTVFGDVCPGPTGRLTLEPGARITGTTLPQTTTLTLPILPAPTLPAWTAPLDEITGEGQLGKLLVEAGTRVTLRGPLTLVLKKLAIKPGGTLVVDTSDGDVMVYVTKTLVGKPGSTLTLAPDGIGKTAFLVGAPAADPTLVTVVDLQSAGDFNGLLYAPDREVQVAADLRVFGSVVGKNVVLAPGARLTFEVGADSGFDLPGMTGLPQLLSWRPDPLPDEPLVNSRLNATAALALLGRESKPAFDSHEEFEVQIKYKDFAGNKQKVLANLSTFDWSVVKKVKSVKWKDPVTGKMKKVKNLEDLEDLIDD
jgi:hypothetical protein